MLSGLLDGLLCCLTGRSANVVCPLETSELADGYEFVEVKPGRVLRVRHVVPERPLVEEPRGPGATVSCKRRITLYRNGQMLIENLGERAGRAELSNGQVAGGGGGGGGGGGEAEPNAGVALDVTDPVPDGAPGVAGRQAEEGDVGGDAGGGEAGESKDPKQQQKNQQQQQQAPQEQPQGPPQPQDPQQQQQQQQQDPRFRKRKPKRTVVVDCERKITACKGTHADVALFFLHGVGGSLDIWGSQLDFFSQLGYEVIAPDLAGHGASSAPQIAAAYTFYALAEDMRVLFKRYARKRNVLIGHSYGVSFCTFLAHEYPEQVHKVVMINGGGPTALEPSLCSIFNLPTCVLHCLSPILAWSFLKAGFAQQGSRERQLLKENNAFNVSSFVLRATMSGQYWPEGDEAYHAELVVPVLLVHGMCDKFVPVEEDQRMAEILLLAFLKVLDNGSHMIMMECPEAVNTLLHEFLLWEPDTSSQREPKARPATAKAAPCGGRAPEPPEVRPGTARLASANGNTTRDPR
ncbi:protein ABHD8-like [Gadus chalcogrammus]|uniref:protein ABHD8-like n=1 Tax=Gadus chalcogrammus TaxID=1042646 RepID=UPI0024C4C74C|nr:protein ABHD8-like [Gadus chalcogrammus]